MNDPTTVDISSGSAEPLGEPNRYDWRDRYPFLVLFKTFRVAISPPILMLAALGALLGTIGWQIADGIFISDEQIDSIKTLQVDAQYLGAFPGERKVGNCPIGCYEHPPGKQVAERFGAWPDDPMIAVPYRMLRPYYQLTRSTTWSEAGYYLFGAAWTLAIWSLVGCAITRMAVIKLGTEESIDFVSALEVAAKRWLQHVTAMWMPLCGVLTLAIPLAGLGFLMRWNPIAAVAGLLWIVVIPVGVVMALFVLGWMAGWPLLWGALSAEGQDSFDAVSRSYAYVFQQPIRYVGYGLLAAFVGLCGWLVVWLVSELVVYLSLWGISVGLGEAQTTELLSVAAGGEAESTFLWLGGRGIGFWQGVLRTMASAYAYSFFWVAVAAVYLLIRCDVDSVEMDDLFDHENQRDTFDIARLLKGDSETPSRRVS